MAELPDLIPEPEPQRLATGFQFTEGPVWHPDGYLLFSDIFANTIYRLTPDGASELYITPSQHSNGLTYDRQGRLIACQHEARQVARMDADRQLTTAVDRYQGKRLNSPNDVVVKSDGSIYFTDPPFAVAPEDVELDFIAVFRAAPDGDITPLATDFLRPNGLAFSPDESILYVDDSYRRHVRAFDVGPDGSLANGRVLIDMDAENPRNPDGMKVDAEGRVFSTGAGGCWVFDPSGAHLGTIVLPEIPANCAWGGPDNRTMLFTARNSVYTMRMKTPGVPVHGAARATSYG